ncbi:MAG TPA: hypothetical protein VLL52_17090 [Anaerolineae bacterium]|nr:hypothetical protein [Anaerolineae bacterium]
MDISVSRLNNRMAVQLPTELPLGLVFVVGDVENVNDYHDPETPVVCYIRDREHYLRCHFTQRIAEEVEVEIGSKIRAGGHLAFDPQSAQYYLLARDVEVLETLPSLAAAQGQRASLTTILQDVKRRAEATSIATAELPPWVKQLAPPDLKSELAIINQDWEVAAEQVLAGLDDSNNNGNNDDENQDIGLSSELLDQLSAAMDSDEDVDLPLHLLPEQDSEDMSDAVIDEMPLDDDNLVTDEDQAVIDTDVFATSNEWMLMGLGFTAGFILALVVAGILYMTF